MKPYVTLITLGVKDFSASLEFYKDKLGWPMASQPNDSVAFFQLNNLVFGIFKREELAKDAGIEDDGRGFPGFSLAHNVGSKADVDAVFAKAKAIGATIVKEPCEVFWGGYSGYFADPDGFLWEVAFNPHWTLTPEGEARL